MGYHTGCLVKLAFSTSRWYQSGSWPMAYLLVFFFTTENRGPWNFRDEVSSIAPAFSKSVVKSTSCSVGA